MGVGKNSFLLFAPAVEFGLTLGEFGGFAAARFGLGFPEELEGVADEAFRHRGQQEADGVRYGAVFFYGRGIPWNG